MKEDSSFNVLSISDKEEWNAVIRKCINYDFYHLADYHELEAQAVPFLFVYYRKSHLIALPLLKRNIENTPYFDCTTVYGYTGPVSNLAFEAMDKELINGLKESINTFFNQEQIISVFCRMHPLYRQDILLKSMQEIFHNGRTIAIDLKQPVEEQRQKYRKAIRQKINQLRRRGFEVTTAIAEDEIKEFVKIYTEGMIKVGASAMYYFDENYFKQLLSSENIDSKLLLCYFEGRITAGAVVTYANEVMQIHLTGTANNFLQDSPMKLIFDEASQLGRARNMHYLHIGSGVGGQEDSLFHFKSGFSDQFFNLYTWRYIVSKSVYNTLVNERPVASEQKITNLFPLYRFL